MTRTLLSLCLCALLCGCAKKARSTSADADSPFGIALGGAGPGEPKAIAPVRPALPAGWVELQQPDGAFAVFLPASPRLKGMGAGSSLNQPVPVGRALMSDFAAQATGLYCEAGVAVFSPELVDGVRAATERRPVSGANGKRTPVTWAGRPAFEDTSESVGAGRLEVKRWMWIGNRMYYCTLYGQAPDRPTAAERAAVFDSLVVGK